MTRYIIILGTLDTKGAEVDFLRQRVLAEGGRPLVIDTGVLGQPTVEADIDRERVAEAGGSSIQGLIQAGDKARALVVMADGASRFVRERLEGGELGGVLSIGGSRGTALGTRVMQGLPVGVPKLMVSTIASGENTFGPYVGTKDVTLMHSVADIQGVNAVTRPIFTNAAAAIVGMSRVGAVVQRGERRVLTASMLGVTTALVGQLQSLMAAHGCELIAFHSVGAGGRAMEELIAGGLVEGVFDVTPGEMTQLHVGGKFSAGPQRMQAAAQRSIPQVVAPGGVDFIIEGPLDELPARYRGRKIMPHTPTITLVRASAQEMAAVAAMIAERLAESRGPAAVILPLQAFGWFAMQGQPLHDPQADRAFIQALKQRIPARVELLEMDTHINDPLVGEKAAEWMRAMLKL
ncbi:MAG: Tm-1-like ATP-binding domain-containing protein [Anaerolineales bacterium]|nr:Tm-1-like ATP-binding domain-containing protein [Anaerolineales bacterium]